MIVKFPVELRPYTDGLESIEVGGVLVRDVMTKVLTRFPQLAVFLLDNAGEQAHQTSLCLNGERYLFEVDDLMVEVSTTDTLEFLRDIPTGAKGGLFQIIMGAVLIAISIYAPGLGVALKGAIMGAGIGMAIGGVGSLIMGTPKLDYGDGDSPTYSFNGISNTTVSGTPLSIVYGRHRVGGHLLNVYTDLVGKKTTNLYAQVGLCEGPVTEIYDTRINEKRISSYAANSVELDTRLGTADQTAIPWFNRVENTTSVNQKITNAGTVVEMADACDQIKICVSAPGLIRIKDDGTGSATVEYRVQYRLHGTTDPWVSAEITGPEDKWRLDKTLVKLSGETKSEISREDEVKFPARGAYDIRVVRVTQDRSSDNKYTDDIYVKSINRLLFDEFDYPHTAILGVKIKATDQINGGMPKITTMVKGRKVLLPTGYNGDSRRWVTPWNGTMSSTRQWTDNPAWCLFDLITDKRSGLGRYINIEPHAYNLVVAQFVLMGNYCDDTVDTGDTYTGVYYNAGTVGARVVINSTAELSTVGVGQSLQVIGTENSAKVVRVEDTTVTLSADLPYPDGTELNVRTLEPRFSLNVVIDTPQAAIEVLNSLVACMRGCFFYSDGRLQIDIDRPKPISHLYTMSNIVEGSFTRSIASRRETPNALEVQFPNSATDYEIDTFRVESVELRSNPHIEERSKALQLKGVTSFSHALRMAKYILYAGRYEGSTVAFRTGSEGFCSMVGDVIGLQHDVPQWGFGGRVASLAGAVVGLSEPTVLDVTCQYVLRLNRKIIDQVSGELVPITVPISFNTANAEGNQVTVTEVTLTEALPGGVALSVGDVYQLGEVSNSVRPFRITMLRRAEDETIEVAAVDYHEELYALCDSADGGGMLVETNYSRLRNPMEEMVRDVRVEERTWVDQVGTLHTGIAVFFSVPTTNSFWDGAIVCYAETGSDVFTEMPINRTGYVLIPDLLANTSYDIVVLSQFKDGTRQSIEQILALTGEIPVGSVVVSGMPSADPLPSVRGLELFGQATGTEFLTPDAAFVWKKTSLEPLLDVGHVDYEAGEGFLSQAFKDYRVEIWADNLCRRVDYVPVNQYTYDFLTNTADGNGTPARTFTIKVWVRDKFNRQSATPAVLTVTNPQLPAVTNLRATPALGGCLLTWDEVLTTDFAGYRVYAHTESDFTPGPTNMVYTGRNNQVTLSNLLSDTAWHFKVAAFDSFNADDLNFAGLSFLVEGTNILDTEPPSVPTGLTVERVDAVGTSAAIKATWEACAASDFSHYLVRVRKSGETGGTVFPAYSTSFRAEGFSVSALYFVTVSAMDKWGNRSDWAAEVPVGPVTDSAPPAAPTNLQVQVAFKSVFLRWDNPADLDLKHCEVVGNSEAVVGSAFAIGTSIDGTLTDTLTLYGDQRFYWVRAVDVAGNVSAWAGPIAASAGRVQTTDLAAFAVDASKLFTKIPVVSGDSWQDRVGGADVVGWNAHALVYNGVQYSIASSSTGNKYIYWKFGESQYRTSNTYPALTSDDFLIGTNVGGYHDLAWNALANQVVGTAHIQQAAIQDLHVDSLAGDKIRVNTLHGDRVIADTLDAKAIKTGTLTADKIVSFASGVVLDGFIEPNYDDSGPNPGEFGVGTWKNDGTKLRGQPTIKVTVSGQEYTITGGMVVADEDNRKATMLMFTLAPARFADIFQVYTSACSHIFAVYQVGGQWYCDDNAVGSTGLSGIPFSFDVSTDFIIGTFGWNGNSIAGWQPALTAQTTISGNRITTGVIDANRVQVSGAGGTTLIGDGQIHLGEYTGSQVAEWAANPAAKVNSGTTKLSPGMVEVRGGSGVTLAEWAAAGGEGTLIDGGKIYTRSIQAQALSIGMHPNLVRGGFDSFDTLQVGREFPASGGVTLAKVSAAKSLVGRHSVVVSATVVGGQVYLGDSITDYSIPLTGGQSYLISGYVYTPSSTGVAGRLRLKTSDGAVHDALVSGVTVGAGWIRASAKVTPAVGVTGGMLVLQTDTADALLYWDCLMVELVEPGVAEVGAWRPAGVTSIDGGLITAESIVGSQIKAGEIVADHVAAGVITASHLAAGSVTAEKLTSGELITSSAQIKDGIIDGAKITGAIQSDNFSPTAGWKLDKSGPAAGHAEFHSMTVRNGIGDIILDSGSGVAWDAVYGKTGLAAVDKITSTVIGDCIDPGVISSTFIKDLTVDTLKIGANAVGAVSAAAITSTYQTSTIDVWEKVGITVIQEVNPVDLLGGPIPIALHGHFMGSCNATSTGKAWGYVRITRNNLEFYAPQQYAYTGTTYDAASGGTIRFYNTYPVFFVLLDMITVAGTYTYDVEIKVTRDGGSTSPTYTYATATKAGMLGFMSKR